MVDFSILPVSNQMSYMPGGSMADIHGPNKWFKGFYRKYKLILEDEKYLVSLLDDAAKHLQYMDYVLVAYARSTYDLWGYSKTNEGYVKGVKQAKRMAFDFIRTYASVSQNEGPGGKNSAFYQLFDNIYEEASKLEKKYGGLEAYKFHDAFINYMYKAVIDDVFSSVHEYL